MLRLTANRGGVAAASLAAILTACAHDAAAPGAASKITPQQAVAVGTRLSREIGTSLNALTLGGSGGFAAASLRTARGVQRAAPAAGAPCPAIDNTTDSDHDGIPDNATLTFALPQCESVVNGDSTEVTGTVHLTDPVYSPPPSPAAFGYEASLSDLTVHFGAMDADSSFTDTRNGAELLLLGPQGLAQTHGFRIAHQDHGGLANVVDQWNATFTPAPGQALVPGVPLPPGFFAAQGHTSWARGDAVAQFEIITAIPLAYDPTCPESAPNRIRSGEIHASFVGPGQQAYVRIVFADCAAPDVTFMQHQP